MLNFGYIWSDFGSIGPPRGAGGGGAPEIPTKCVDFEVPLASHLAPFLHLNPLKIYQKIDMFFNPFLDDIFMRKLVQNEAKLTSKTI